MSEEHDSWLEGIGVDVGGALQVAAQNIESIGVSAIQGAQNAVSAPLAAMESIGSSVSQAANSASGSVGNSSSGAGNSIQDFTGGLVRGAEAAVSGVVQTFSDLATDAVEAVEEAFNADPGIALAQVGPVDSGGSDAGNDAGGAEEPTFSHSESTNKILADSASEFVSKANQVLGGGAVGELQPDVSWNLETDNRGRVTRVNMSVKSRIVRPVWAGGRPIGNEGEVIKKAQRLVQEHELRHRGILEDFTRRAVTAARGKSAAEAEKTLKKFMKDMDAAQDALDAREGMLRILSGQGRETDVILVPVGRP